MGNGYHWPFALQLDGTGFPDSDLSPEAQWDALTGSAKWQIILFVGALELLDESSCGDLENKAHYMRGGKPGSYPAFSKWINLYDLFGFLSADAVPGSVPLLADIAKQYDGNIMVPFAG